MDLWYMGPGHKIKMHGGAEAEVLSKTEDGEWDSGEPQGGLRTCSGQVHAPPREPTPWYRQGV
jgi:hypothetical protein